jgi:flagellar motor switch/type III secretory pathway protein FliN
MAAASAVSGPVQIPESAWQEAGWLPCRVAAELAVRAFTLGDLLSLEAGSLVDTGVSTEADVSVRVNGVRVGSGKLAQIAERRGVRVTELL